MLRSQVYRLLTRHTRNLPPQACCLRRTLNIQDAYLCRRKEHQNSDVHVVRQPSGRLSNLGTSPHHDSCQLLMLIWHLRRHEKGHDKGHKSSACDFEGCSKTFNQSKDLVRHKETVHADQISTSRPVQTCDQCGYNTRRADHFKRHGETHKRSKKKRKRKGD